MTQFTASGFFVLRTPLLPLQDFLSLSQGLCFFQTLRNHDDPTTVAASDRRLVRARLQQLVDRPEVKEALWLASPDFFEALAVWRKEPEGEKGQKLEYSLYRYVARMASRPTPFGLFAGCTLGRIGSQTRLEIGERTSYYRRSRLDMEYLCNLAEKISSDPASYNRLSFRPNTSLYLAAGRYHHIQGYLDHDQRAYRLIATEPTSYLTATLERAHCGATPSDLALALAHDLEISLEDAQEYIHRLIESQILVSDLAPPITGPEPIEDMLAHLDRLDDSSLKRALESIAEQLRQLDQGRLGNCLQGYVEIVNTATALPADFKREHLVQVDMMKPAAQVSLDQRLICSILQAVEALHSLIPAPTEGPLEQFKKDFRERYQEQEVPLLLALDEEIGIGFERKDSPGSVPEPLLEDLDLSGADDSAVSRATKTEFILLRKLQELAAEKKSTLEVDAALLELLRTRNPLPLPNAFAVIGSLVGPPDGPDERFSFFLQTAIGPSGALLLGRFCHCDTELATLVQHHLRCEEAIRASDSVVFAEVAHLPEGRIGNILYRPHLRHYEIPFLASSRLPSDRQIAVADLMVSVQNDRVVLRSRRLRCEVIPRLTSAHNFSLGRNLKLYKFLCLLQTEGVSNALAWDWGILNQALFLPRVVFNNVILAPACWRLTREMIKRLEAGKSDTERLRQIEEWRTRMRVPRFVLLAEADNQLLIDWENVLSVETFLDYMSKRDSARLVEMLPGPERLCVRGPEGRFTNEVVVPFVRQEPAEAHARKSSAEPGTETPQMSVHASTIELTKIGRTFLPGSEWLFAKIYASPTQVDHLLLDRIAPLVSKVMAAGTADGWFFIRYADPQWHLRLRFHGEPNNLSAQVLPQLWERLERENTVGRAWRVQLDTYDREIERYGGPAGMQIAERLFQFDSELVLELLAATGDLGGKGRWRLAFCAVDTLLSGLGLDVTARYQLVNGLGKMQEKRFAVDHRYRKQLSGKFRDERRELEKLLMQSADEVSPAAQAALCRFRGRLQTIQANLKVLQQRRELSKSVFELAGSYVHMHLNRIFRSAGNAQEMVLYDFLARTYESRLRRK